jgi:sugar phosphate isomerase/epimerase
VLCGEDPVQMIYKLGRKYLHVTHVHDNDYLNDDHYMPGIGKIDWYAIGRALNDIGYEGVFNFEANRTFERIVPFRNELTMDFLKVYIEMARAITNVK